MIYKGSVIRLWGNDYNRMEFAGAFGNLGTLIHFVMGYITLNKMDPLGILVAFGLFKLFVGLCFLREIQRKNTILNPSLKTSENVMPNLFQHLIETVDSSDPEIVDPDPEPSSG